MRAGVDWWAAAMSSAQLVLLGLLLVTLLATLLPTLGVIRLDPATVLNAD